MLPVAFNCKGWLKTTEVSEGPASAIILITFTLNIFKTGFGQPKVSLTETVYVIDFLGKTAIGFGISILFKYDDGDHK